VRALLVLLVVSVGLTAQAQVEADAGVSSVVDAGSPNAALEARVAELERRLVDEQQQRAAQVGVLEQGVAFLKELPAVLTARGVRLTLGGFVQADGQWRQSSLEQLDDSTRQPLNETRFLIRRARLRPQVDSDYVSGALEADFNTVAGSQVRLIGAEVSVHTAATDGRPPLLQLTAGQFKLPFGLEVPQSDRERLFIDRSSVVRSLFPGEYDLGLRLSGQWRFLTFAAAWMNGHPIGEKGFALQAPLAPRDVVGRLGVDAKVVPAVRVEAGVSVLIGSGFHAGSPATKDQLVWRDINGDNVAQLTELQVIPGSPASPSSAFARQAVGGDVRVSLDLLPLGTTTVQGELVWSKNLDRLLDPSDPVAVGRDLRGLGWHAALTQQLTKWAQLGVRYDRYSPDLDALDSRAGQVVPKDLTVSTLAVTAAFVWKPALRVMVEYDHNTNANGRTAQGVPTTLADDALIGRAEVSF
jgi:hypothetical protein